MALKKEAPEFDVDDDVLLLETGIVLDDDESNEESDAPVSKAKSKSATSL